MAVTDRSVTSRTVAQHIQSVTHHPVSSRTIRRSLQQRGMSERRPLPRLPLTQNHRGLRRQWCDERRMWTAEWNEIVFSDESRFCLQHHHDRIRVRRNRGERMLNSCVMHRHTGPAPGIIVWGGIGYHTRFPLVRIADNQTPPWFCTGYYGMKRYWISLLHSSSTHYRYFKQPTLHLRGVGVNCPSYLQGLPTAIFKQDNARPHVARIVQRFFVNRQIELLPWPAHSLNLSPIENMWSIVA
ncbi:hypothetical protein LAZ67_17000304 [Cordylochernes scorpioides]|uniref:Transposase Tc1-like domain-containing protein n=1 Tax=Cordylochernes scorpioides TaxID=51811 RepID=A0ABY6LFE3_9ARAC|nr:hypothetical protein LAZ67_17000304 [Cordylochernes scorpioides]